MKNIAKTLKSHLTAMGYVLLDSQAMSEIAEALNLGAQHVYGDDDPEKESVMDAGIKAMERLAKPMSHGHALEVVAKLNGLKDWNSFAAIRSQATPEVSPILTGEIDYEMAGNAEDDRLWVTVRNVSVYIRRTNEGVIVDLYALGAEDGGSLASCSAEYVDAEETLRESGYGWAIYSPNENVNNGLSWWNNEMGWVDEEECTVFSESEKARFTLPESLGNDAVWVQLSGKPCDFCGSAACHGECDEALANGFQQKTECIKRGLPTQVDDYGLCNFCHDMEEQSNDENQSTSD